MLARAAADFYWMGRYFERTEHTARLLQYQLTRLVDTPADELALSWRVVYRALGQNALVTPTVADEAESFLLADAYTLAASLVEETTNPDSMIRCWTMARENAKQLRPWLPVRVWTCLNQGFFWIRDCDFPRAWGEGPAGLAGEAIDRLRLLAGVVDARMPRDDAWRFLELGRFVERLQHQAALLDAWDRVGQDSGDAPSLSWAGLLRVCGAYEFYCRAHSMVIRRGPAVAFLARNPELPWSLSFAVQRIEKLLAGIDPRGARYPLAAPHRMVLRLSAAVEADPADGEDPGEGRGPLEELLNDSRALHAIIVATYFDYPVETGLPS